MMGEYPPLSAEEIVNIRSQLNVHVHSYGCEPIRWGAWIAKMDEGLTQ